MFWKYLIQILILISAYLIGSIPWGFLFGKIKGIDIRQYGSKNIGATNTGRVLGTKYAIFTFFLDALKGLIPVGIFTSGLVSMDYCFFSPILYGLAASLGHTFPIYLGFKGGKSVATGGGIILAYSPILFLALIGVFFIVTYITRYVSMGSLSAAVTGLIGTFIVVALKDGFNYPGNIYNWTFPVGAILIVIIIFIRHKNNINNVIHKNESKVKWRKSSND